MNPDKVDKWMELCDAGAKIFSTCSRRQYMAIILGADGRVVGTGYNGSPPGADHCTAGACPRARSTDGHGAPYGNCIAIHAEANALLYSDRTARAGGWLIINGPPCWDCAKLIAGSGLRGVYYRHDPAYHDWPKVFQLLIDAYVQVLEV